MRMLSLAAFAILALVIGGYQEDEMTLLIGAASAWPRSLRCRGSEAVDLLWHCSPTSSPSRPCCSASSTSSRSSAIGRTEYEAYSCPATCRWRRRCSSSSFSASRIFAWCQDDDDHRPFFAAADADLDLPVPLGRAWPCARATMPGSMSSSSSSSISFRWRSGFGFNFFHEGFRQRDPGRRRSAYASRSGISCCGVFMPAGDDLDPPASWSSSSSPRISCCNGGAG